MEVNLRKIIDRFQLVLIGEGTLKSSVAGKGVVVVQQLPIEQCTQLLATIALVDTLRKE